MTEHEGISIKLVLFLVEEFSTVDSTYELAREALPVTANGQIYDAITNSICDDALYNVIERLPDSLSSLVEEISRRNPAELSLFVRELYETWVEKGKPPCGDTRGDPYVYLI
jgi:hypothetical protein